jgi:hypothetical protein
VIGDIVGILTDKARHTRERRNSNILSDGIYQGTTNPWDFVIDEAREQGFTVESAGDFVNLSRHSNDGWSSGNFAYNEGGAVMAREFLEGA